MTDYEKNLQNAINEIREQTDIAWTNFLNLHSYPESDSESSLEDSLENSLTNLDLGILEGALVKMERTSEIARRAFCAFIHDSAKISQRH